MTGSRTSSKPAAAGRSDRGVQLPPEQHHDWKFLAFGPDNKLYVPIGAPCNICEPSPDACADPPLQCRRLAAWRSSRAACAIRSASISTRSTRRALVHRQRPRLGRRGRAGGGAQPRFERSARTSASPIAMRRAWPIPTSRSPMRATASRSRLQRSGRTPLRSACASTPARCSRPNTATRLHRPARLVEPQREIRL